MVKKKLLVFLSLLLLCACSANNNSSINSSYSSESSIEEANSLISKEEYFVFQEEITIYGNLYKPENYSEHSSYPLIIMSHSANVNSDTLNSYAIRSACLGYLVYTFDFPGSSSSSRSTDISSCTIFTEIDTLSFIVDYFSFNSNINKIFLFGTSQGGLVSSVVADEKEELISGLILFYPAYNIPETILKFPFLSDKEYVEQLKDYNVYEHIGKFKKDVLIVHGTSDFMVPYSYSEKADELYENSTLYLVEGANHGFNKENHYFNNDYDALTWSYVSSYLINHYKN